MSFRIPAGKGDSGGCVRRVGGVEGVSGANTCMWLGIPAGGQRGRDARGGVDGWVGVVAVGWFMRR